MPAEHNRPNGLGQGYYCTTCGAPGLSMMGSSQHGQGKCEPDMELVERLRRLNDHAPRVMVADTKQTLGDKLAKTIAELDAAKINTLDAQAIADLAKIRKDREALSTFVDNFRDYLIDSIMAEKVPARKVTDYTRQEWVRQAAKGSAAHQDIWNSLRNWASEQGLVVVVREEHDGQGMASWITLTVDTVRSSTRSV